MRLLVVSASAGAGHTRAAQAVEDAARAAGHEATHVDVLDFAAGTYKKAYVGSYLKLVDSAPAVWGYLYKASDKAEKGPGERFARFFDKLEFARFRRFVKDGAFDAVVSTHFLPPQVFTSSRAHGRKREGVPPVAVVVTDFDVHAFWVQEAADLFCVASEELRAVLAGRGIPEARIHVTGIPIA